MCVVSMISDHYGRKWGDTDWSQYNPPPFRPPVQLYWERTAEFEALRKQVEEMKELLIRAKEYDERNNEPECEMEDKVAKLKEIGRIMGVDIESVFVK